MIFAAALTMALLIATSSFEPFHLRSSLHLHSTSALASSGLLQINIHRIAHLSAFGILNGLLCASVKNTRDRLLCTVAAISFAVLTELGQFLTSTSVFETWDVRDDAVACCAALILVLAITRPHRPDEAAL